MEEMEKDYGAYILNGTSDASMSNTTNITYPQSMWDPDWRWEVEMQDPPFHNPFAVLINISMIQPPYITKPLYAIVVPTIIIVSFVTNSLIFFVCNQPVLRTPTNMVLLTMAGSELATGISSLPWSIYYLANEITEDFQMSDFWCKFHQIFALHLPSLFHTMSIWLTCYLAIQRFCFVFFPVAMLCYTQRTNIKILIGLCLWACISEFPKICLKTLRNHKGRSGRTYCLQNHVDLVEKHIGYNTYMSYTYAYKLIFVHVIPCLLLVLFTIGLFIKLRVQDIKRAKLLRPDENEQNKTKTTITSGATSGTPVEAVMLEAGTVKILLNGVPLEQVGHEGGDVKPEPSQGHDIIVEVVVEGEPRVEGEGEKEGEENQPLAEGQVAVDEEAKEEVKEESENQPLVEGGQAVAEVEIKDEMVVDVKKGEGSQPLVEEQGDSKNEEVKEEDGLPQIVEGPCPLEDQVSIHEIAIEFVQLGEEPEEKKEEEKIDVPEPKEIVPHMIHQLVHEDEIAFIDADEPEEEPVRTLEEEIGLLVEGVITKVVQMLDGERAASTGGATATDGQAPEASEAGPNGPPGRAERPPLKLMHTSTQFLFIIVIIHLLVEVPVAFLLVARFCAERYGYQIIGTVFATEFTNCFMVVRNFVIIISYPFNFTIYFGMSSTFKKELISAYCMPCLRWRRRRRRGPSDSDDWAQRFSMTKSSDESNLSRFRRMTADIHSSTLLIDGGSPDLEEGRRDVMIAGSHCVLYDASRHSDLL